jgi:hypothetical protein
MTTPPPAHRHIDVCNGDADGLCARRQWRLAHPQATELVTGLKRDIALLRHVQAGAGDHITVFDLGMDRNQADLRRLLAAGAHVRYIDHHATGDIPRHPHLQLHIDLASEACTSLIVDQMLHGAQRDWALVGAYGDNLHSVADALAIRSGHDTAARDRLRVLGEALNHNAYGDEPGDVTLAPADLDTVLARHPDPFTLMQAEPVIATLIRQRADDLQQGLLWPADTRCSHGRVRVLPDAPWCRRVIGSLANELATQAPDQAQAVLKALPGGGHVVSVRAPLRRPSGADRLCAQFGGSGRARAGGIACLPDAELPRFLAAFDAMNWGGPAP